MESPKQSSVGGWEPAPRPSGLDYTPQPYPMKGNPPMSSTEPPKYSHPIAKLSPTALEAMSKIRTLEARGAPGAAIDAAYDAYWNQVDDEQREAQRLNDAIIDARVREANRYGAIPRGPDGVEARKLEFYRLQRQSEADAAWRKHTGNVNGFGS